MVHIVNDNAAEGEEQMAILDRIKRWSRKYLFTESRGQQLRNYFLILVGAAVQAVSLHLFFIPAELVAGGLSGSAQIIHSLTGWPIGTMVLIANIPLFFLGWRYLGRRRFLVRTIAAATAFSVILDFLQFQFPNEGLTEDLLLNALYGGVLAGIGAGLVFRASATTGGTDILARFLDRRFGIPLSHAYLYTDGLVVFLAALAFSWEQALYAVVGLYVGALVTEYTLTGPRLIYVATIITQSPEKVAERILQDLQRGVTNWTGRGMYTGNDRQLLMCVVSRAEISQLKLIVHEADPRAFLIIGQAQEVLGEGFRALLPDD